MKITVYSYRMFDEDAFFKKFAKELGVEIVAVEEPLSLENVHLSKGSYGVSIITTVVDQPIIDALLENGVKHLSTRCIGYDHIDIEAAKKSGLEVSNITYDIHGVAEYTVMLMIMAIRKIKRINERSYKNDFSLNGKLGTTLFGKTVGVVVTGAIGKNVVRILNGFGAKVIAYDKYPDPTLECKYVSLETLYKESDIITYHAPLLKETFHMFNKDSLEMMKDDVVIINTSRGSVVDTKALIEGLQSGKIGAAAIDVMEDEFNLYYYDLSKTPLEHPYLDVLRGFDNCIFTAHMAFYTEESVADMCKNSMISIIKSYNHKENKYRIV